MVFKMDERHELDVIRQEISRPVGGYIKRDDDWSLARGCRTMDLFSPRRRTNHCPVTIRSTVIIHERGKSDDARLPRAGSFLAYSRL